MTYLVGTTVPRAAPLTIRESSLHWRTLACLLARFESCVEHAARLDATRGTREAEFGNAGGVQRKAREFATRLDGLRHTVDREVARLTAERILSELARRQADDAAGRPRVVAWREDA